MSDSIFVSVLLLEGAWKDMPRCAALPLLLALLSGTAFLSLGMAKIVTRHYKRSEAGLGKTFTLLPKVPNVKKEIDCGFSCMSFEHGNCGGFTFFR